MQKTKAARNKTIDLSVEEGAPYLKRCLNAKHDLSKPENILNKTILADTFAVLKKLPTHFADLIIVDPPYNLSKNYDGKKFNALNAQKYEQYTTQWVEQVKPLLKENGSIYVCCDWKSSLVIGPVLQKYFKIRNRITWQREKGRGAASNWKNGMEDIWFATNSDVYTFNLNAVKIRKKVLAPYKQNGLPKDWEATDAGNFRNTCPSNFWDDISVPYWSMPENTAHPTQKPEKLLAKLILASSNAGDVVFDPFLGSGTTSVVCKKLGRLYCGIEQNERYCIFCEKRLEMAEHNKNIQGFEGGVFFERNAGNIQRKNTSKKKKQA